MLDAIASAADVPGETVRRAFMLSGRLPETAVAALEGGAAVLEAFRLEVGRPLRPMLASPAESLDEALTEANAVAYGLTAGIFSEDEAERQTFLDRIEAGVVYVNRREGATTGAWPGIQTFCGWKASGVSGKGGLGPHYLTQFMREQSRTVMVS